MSVVTVSRELLDRYNKPGPRYTSYPTVPAWTGSFGEDDYRLALRDFASQPDAKLSIYVHHPFCAERCFYCGCNATVTKKEAVVDAYLDRLERETQLVAATLGDRQQVVQIHWGGGTPNFLTAAQTRRAFELLTRYFEIDYQGEISVEVDPRIGTREQLEVYRDLGFNRISLGVQDFDPRVQESIGRIQPQEMTESFYANCRELGFESVNLDIVYGLPYQDEATFHRTLSDVIKLGPDRLACFSYAHVPWVKPNQKQVNADVLPSPYEKFDLFQMAIATLTDAGYDWIGMDHFARKDDEMAVAVREKRLHRNFMGYTTQSSPHMIALGMSGIGDLAGHFVQNDAKLGNYQKMLDEGHLPVVRGHHLSQDDKLRRKVIVHMMCNLELPYNLTEQEFGASVDLLLGEELERLRPFEEEGFLEFGPDRIEVTTLGRFFIRNLCMELDAYLDNNQERQLFSKTI